MAKVRRFGDEAQGVVSVYQVLGPVAGESSLRAKRLERVVRVQDCPAKAMGLHWVILDWNAFPSVPTPQQLAMPVKLDDVDELYKVRYFGSSVKELRTVALPQSSGDLLWECGLLEYAEQTIYTGTFFSGPAYGGGYIEDLGVLTVKEGTEFTLGGHKYVIGDGMSLVRASVFDALREGNEADRISLTRARPTYQDVMWFPITSEVWTEWQPLLDMALADINMQWRMQQRQVMDEKLLSRISKLHPDLEPKAGGRVHRAQATWFEISWAEYALRTSYSVRFEGTQTRVGVPSPADNIILPQAHGQGFEKSILLRFPVQGPECTAAVDVVTSGSLVDWADTLRVGQWRLLNDRVFIKEACLLIPDEDMPAGVDVITEFTSRKMAVGGRDKARRVGHENMNVMAVITQEYEPGRVVLLPPAVAKALTGDFDGDVYRLFPGVRYPATFEVCASLPRWAGGKVRKSKRTITKNFDLRYKCASMAMQGLMGRSVNCLVELLQYPVWCIERVAKLLGQPSGAALLRRMDTVIVQTSTDAVKTLDNVDGVLAELNALDHIMHDPEERGGLGFNCPWLRWNRDNPFEWGEVPTTADWDERFVGTIDTILKYTLPRIEVPQGSDVWPLTHFLNWTPEPAQHLRPSLMRLGKMYQALVRSTDRQNESSMAGFRTAARKLFRDWMEENHLDEDTAAAAIWWRAHNNDTNGTVLALMPFYLVSMDTWERVLSLTNIERAKELAKKEVLELYGVYYNMMGPLTGKHKVVVMEYTNTRGNPKKALCTLNLLPGQMPAKPPYAPNQLGTLDSCPFESGELLEVEFYPMAGRGRYAVKVLASLGYSAED